MRKMNPVRGTIEPSSNRGSKDDPNGACTFRRKRMGIMRERTKSPVLVKEGMRVRVSQIVMGDVPKENAKIV